MVEWGKSIVGVWRFVFMQADALLLTGMKGNFLEQSNLVSKKRKLEQNGDGDMELGSEEDNELDEDNGVEGEEEDNGVNEIREDQTDEDENTAENDLMFKLESKKRVWVEEEKSHLLPVKNGSKIIPVRNSNQKKVETVMEIESEEEMENSFVEKETERQKMAYAAAQELEQDPEVQALNRKLAVSDAKKRIALLGEQILENPEKNIMKVEEFLSFCFVKDPVIVQLGLVSCAELFKDIIPGYRIRLPTEAELKVKVSLDVAIVRKFEAALLKNYSRYLKLLFSFAATVKNKSSLSEISLDNANADVKKKLKKRRRLLQKEGLTLDEAREVAKESMSAESLRTGQVAVACLSRLLAKLHHFNYSKDIIVNLIPMINSKISTIGLPVYQGVLAVFEADKSGNATLEIMRILGKIVKDRPTQASVRMMKLFLKLKLSFAIINSVEKKQKHKIKKAGSKDEDKFARRKHKEVQSTAAKELERDMEEAEAEVSLKVKQKVQVELLDLIFTTYFRVLFLLVS